MSLSEDSESSGEITDDVKSETEINGIQEIAPEPEGQPGTVQR